MKQEISCRSVSINFDGTTHVAEAFVLILRFVGDNWELKQRVVSFRLLSKSLTGEEVARLIVESISTELGITTQLMVAAMHDRASINLVALRTMKTPVLDEFIKHYRYFFFHTVQKPDWLGHL